MYGGMIFFYFLYFIAFMVGMAFLVCLIVFMIRYISLKKEQNQLFREYIGVMKEKKQQGD